MEQILENQQILTELKAIRKDLDVIKRHVDDIFLSDEDEKVLEEAEKEHLEGKTGSLDELEEEMSA